MIFDYLRKLYERIGLAGAYVPAATTAEQDSLEMLLSPILTPAQATSILETRRGINHVVVDEKLDQMRVIFSSPGSDILEIKKRIGDSNWIVFRYTLRDGALSQLDEYTTNN